MKVRFHKFEYMSSKTARFLNLQAMRYDYDVSFSSSVVAGDAFLRIFEPQGGKWRIKQEISLNKDVVVDLSVEGKTEVIDLGSTDTLPESIRPLGLRGHFEIIAHLVEHFNTSEGPALTACGFPFCLLARNFPQGTLEIETGNLVRITTQKLTFVTFGLVAMNLKRRQV